MGIPTFGAPHWGPVQSSAIWGMELALPGEDTFMIEDNIVTRSSTNPGNQMAMRDWRGTEYDAQFTYANNIVYNWGAPEEDDTTLVPYGGARGIAKRSQSVPDMENPGWVAPERSLGSYNAMLGVEATMEAFFDVVRTRGRSWL